MSKTDGIGVLSLSLEFLHVRRWPRAPDATPKPPGAPPTVFVAVNFDDPAPLDADVTELPEGDVSKRADLSSNAATWHGLRLTSMQDILHVEVRSNTHSSQDDDESCVMASFSGPVTSFLEEAFLESDQRGAKISFELGDVAAAQFRVKFHLQGDILRALCDGVGLDVASFDSVKQFAPPSLVALCGAAETLTDGFSRRTPEKDFDKSFDAKAAAQEREESAAFRRRGGHGFEGAFDAGANAAFGRSYAALTAGVKKFLASKRADGRADEHERASNLVRLLSDAR